MEDHPDVVKGVYAGWNQDNGTGRIINVGPGPFTAATDRFVSYLREVPSDISGWIRISPISPPAVVERTTPHSSVLNRLSTDSAR